MKRLLSTPGWDPDPVQGLLTGCVIKHLGEPARILAIEEKGILGKGAASDGVARQHSGTAS